MSDKQTAGELQKLIEQYQMRIQVAQTDIQHPDIWLASKSRLEDNIAALQDRLASLIARHSDPHTVILESTAKIKELRTELKVLEAGGQEVVDKRVARLQKLQEQIAKLQEELS